MEDMGIEERIDVVLEVIKLLTKKNLMLQLEKNVKTWKVRLRNSIRSSH